MRESKIAVLFVKTKNFKKLKLISGKLIFYSRKLLSVRPMTKSVFGNRFPRTRILGKGPIRPEGSATSTTAAESNCASGSRWMVFPAKDFSGRITCRKNNKTCRPTWFPCPSKFSSRIRNTSYKLSSPALWFCSFFPPMFFVAVWFRKEPWINAHEIQVIEQSKEHAPFA